MKNIFAAVLSIVAVILWVCFLSYLSMGFSFIGPTSGTIINKYYVPYEEQNVLEINSFAIKKKDNMQQSGHFFEIKTSWRYKLTRYVSKEIYNQYNIGDEIKWSR